MTDVAAPEGDDALRKLTEEVKRLREELERRPIPVPVQPIGVPVLPWPYGPYYPWQYPVICGGGTTITFSPTTMGGT